MSGCDEARFGKSEAERDEAGSSELADKLAADAGEGAVSGRIIEKEGRSD